MRKLVLKKKTHSFPKAGLKHTLFGSHVQVLSGSAIVMGHSIVFRLVIWSIDWTRSQLSFNLCREAEDTVSLRRKERWKQEVWSKGKMMFSYAWLGLWKEHVFPDIARWPEGIYLSVDEIPLNDSYLKAINWSISTWFMLFVCKVRCK